MTSDITQKEKQNDANPSEETIKISTINNSDYSDTLIIDFSQVNKEEFKLNMIPFKIRRPLPNELYELWNFEELNKDHLYFLLE